MILTFLILTKTTYESNLGVRLRKVAAYLTAKPLIVQEGEENRRIEVVAMIVMPPSHLNLAKTKSWF